MHFTLIMGALGLASQALAVPYPSTDPVPEPRAEAIPEAFRGLEPEAKQLESRQPEPAPIPESEIAQRKGRHLEARQNRIDPNDYLKQTPEYILKELIGNILCAQTQIKELSPSCNHAFDKSIEAWKKLEEHVRQTHTISEIEYIKAIEALRDAIRHLKHNDVERNPKFRQLIYNLLLNQLFLIGFLNEAHGSTDIPPYLIDRPGDHIGSLIHHLGIDSTKSLHIK